MRITRYALASAWLRSTSWGERGAVAFAVLMVAGVLVFSLRLGANVGAHIWRPDWVCGQSLKGGLICVPKPTGRPQP